MMTPKTISARELLKRRDQSPTIEVIDVRSPAEFQAVHVEFARNIPLDRLDPCALMQSRNGHRDEPLYIICHSGSRGQKACEQFHKLGFENVLNVEGGTSACINAGLPIVRGKNVISLERQVRIAAGSLVLLGVILAWLVHPWFVGLSAFVGAGLVFAGITDTCGMGMMLSRMPWNQTRSSNAMLCSVIR